MKQIQHHGPIALLHAILNAPPAAPGKKGRTKTNREAEVIRYIALGNTNKEIGEILQISIKTVEKHRQNIMDKFGLRNTADITRFAVATNIIKIKRIKTPQPHSVLSVSSVVNPSSN